MKLSVVYGLLFAVLLIHVACADWWGKPESIHRNEIKALTFQRGKMTASRRVSPVPQLKCVGGDAGCDKQPDVVQCINVGSDGYDIQWECKAELDSTVRFGRINIGCEGYSDRNDPYVLRGSCGLEYELMLTEEGKQRRYSNSDYNYHRNRYQNDYSSYDDSDYTIVDKPSGGLGERIGRLFVVGMVILVVVGIWRACTSGGAGVAGAAAGAGHGYGGFGGFGRRFMPGGFFGGGWGGYPSSYDPGCTTTAGGVNPTSAFMGGAALGGLAGYAYGRQSQQRHHAPSFTRSFTSHSGSNSRRSSPSTTRTATGFASGVSTR